MLLLCTLTGGDAAAESKNPVGDDTVSSCTDEDGDVIESPSMPPLGHVTCIFIHGMCACVSENEKNTLKRVQACDTQESE